MTEITPNHFHWKFVATNVGQIDPVEITVLGYLDEQSARLAVQDLVKRDNYKLIIVWECTTCKYYDAVAKAQATVAEHIENITK